ncbi:hypothetical protein [Chitinophaga arvensicola]|uniref:DUF4843 domain-containing protein n=1 Tax=Chitinophaga arvensicola TaxID=29529 RepID=A0A1I0R3K7_9BACT|nr:hypothetical protein [Chitinophaga arvensicola]SEW34959.1 hypothetical protein SAMN04488122_2167 [Chitinophaga arvensicola]
MKTIHILFLALTGICLLTLPACSKKEPGFLYEDKMLAVTVKGYNGSDETLEVRLDTMPVIQTPPGKFDETRGCILPAGQKALTLSIKEIATGKIILNKELKKEDSPATIEFFYFNGQVSKMPEVPPLEEGKIKISYMFRPTVTQYAEPVDIVLGKYYFTPKVFEEITRIKNVKPNEFSAPVSISTFATSGQVYNGQPTAVLFLVYVYKAGTNEFYTTGTEYTWHPTSTTAPKPAASVKSAKVYIFEEVPVDNTMSFQKQLEL